MFFFQTNIGNTQPRKLFVHQSCDTVLMKKLSGKITSYINAQISSMGVYVSLALMLSWMCKREQTARSLSINYMISSLTPYGVENHRHIPVNVMQISAFPREIYHIQIVLNYISCGFHNFQLHISSIMLIQWHFWDNTLL